MKATIEIQLQPFSTPNFVRLVDEPSTRGEGILAATTYPLSALDPQTLYQLCSDFRTEVFMKAGKQMPARCKDANE